MLTFPLICVTLFIVNAKRCLPYFPFSKYNYAPVKEGKENGSRGLLKNLTRPVVVLKSIIPVEEYSSTVKEKAKTPAKEKACNLVKEKTCVKTIVARSAKAG